MLFPEKVEETARLEVAAGQEIIDSHFLADLVIEKNVETRSIKMKTGTGEPPNPTANRIAVRKNEPGTVINSAYDIPANVTWSNGDFVKPVFIKKAFLFLIDDQARVDPKVVP